MADPSTDPLLREIEEDLKRDRLERLWKRYGSWVIGAALVVVAGVAAAEAWRGYQAKQRLETTASLFSATQLAAGDPQTAEQRLAAVAAAGRGDAKALALLQQASLRAGAKDFDSAAADLRGAAGAARTAALQDAATIVAGYTLLRGNPSPDALEALRAELRPRLEARHPWRFSARELAALIDVERGDRAAARQTLSELVADPETPAGIRTRAADMLAQLDHG